MAGREHQYQQLHILFHQINNNCVMMQNEITVQGIHMVIRV